MRFLFVITYSAGTSSVNPVDYSNAKIGYDQSSDEAFFRLKFKGKLKFIGADYQLLKAIDEINPCEEIVIKIYLECPGSTDLLFNGKFSTGSGSFNYDTCIFEVTPQVNDEAVCLDKILRIEQNTVSVRREGTNIQFYEIQNNPGTLHRLNTIRRYDINDVLISCTATYDGVSGACPANYDQWCNIAETVYFLPNETRVISAYTREELTIPDVAGVCVAPDVGWQLLSHVGSDCTFWRCGTGVPTIFDRCRKLNEVIDGFVGAAHDVKGSPMPCNLNYSSIFFDFNPDTSDPVYLLTAGGTLNYHTGQTTVTNNLMWAQKSDIKYPSATNPAISGICTLENMLNWLRYFFNVYYSVKNGNLVLEHIDYYKKFRISLDITTYPDQQKGKNQIERIPQEIPVREIFKCMEDGMGNISGALYYRKGVIEYDSPCATGDEITYHAERVTVALSWVLNNVTNYPDFISDDGFMLIATRLDMGDYIINYEQIQGVGPALLNGHMLWQNLLVNYHKVWRFLPTGKLNDIQTTFGYWRPNTKQPTIELQECCSGPRISPDNKYLTILGRDYLNNVPGEVHGAEFSFNDLTWRINFKYPL